MTRNELKQAKRVQDHEQIGGKGRPKTARLRKKRTKAVVAWRKLKISQWDKIKPRMVNL